MYNAIETRSCLRPTFRSSSHVCYLLSTVSYNKDNLNPGSRQLLGERGSGLSLILAELYGV